MVPVRFKNRFGERFIRLQELCNYVADLDLSIHPPSKSLMEFFEAQGLLVPICRIRFSPAILRRLAKEQFPELEVIDPMEPDGAHLDAAADLMHALNMHKWSDVSIYGESVHVLDEIDKAHAPFI
jgi:hypothetical protein